MKKSFRGLIWSSFLRTLGVPVVIIGLVFEWLLWKFAPNDSIPVTLALPIGILAVVVILTLANAAYESFQMSRRILPRILYATKLPNQVAEATALCLLEPSELFSHDMVVSFYFVGHENFEQLMGIGRVVNIQEDNKIQVSVDYALDGHEETVKKLANNDSEVLSKTRVKPSVPTRFMPIAGE